MIVHLMAIPVAYLYSHTYPVRTIGSLVPRPFTQHVATLSAVAAHRVKDLRVRLAYRLTDMASGIDIFTVIFNHYIIGDIKFGTNSIHSSTYINRIDFTLHQPKS